MGAQSGHVVWEQAAAVIDGEAVPLTAAQIDRSAGGVTTDPAQGPTLALTFDVAGTVLFAAITDTLVGYPFGVFLADRLLSAPLVQQRITSGQAAVSGLTEEKLAVLEAIVRSGPLPVAVTVLSIEVR
jgi:preprotein translocase subunit SecD